VIVHAIFVVVESAGAVFVARTFFDNVIGLERIVGDRTRALDSRNQDMARILDHVSQGFISAGLDGSLGGEWSNALERWFGAPAPGAKLWDYLLSDLDQRAWMQVGLEGLVEGFMPFEVVLDQLPCRFAKDGRELHVTYRGVGDPATGLLVVVSDVTDEVARQKAESVQRELMVVVEKAYRNRGEFSTFIAETADLVQQCARPADDEADGSLVGLSRRLHTLKGNTALFGVTSVSTLCHELESAIDDTGEPLSAAARARLVDAWTQVRERIERVLGLTGKRAVVVDWDDYQSVLAAMPMPEPQWAHRMRDWGKVPTRGRLEQFGDYARQLAARLGKAEPAIVVVDHDVRLGADQFATVWPVFVHAVRNMVDHGIEASAGRAAAGKPANGCLTLVTQLQGGELRLEIADDGDGIDWDRVGEQARARGLPAGTRAEIEEALFATGVSTAADITEISGRGVGMGALRSACRELGGRVEVTSKRGAGTRIACVLPLVPVYPTGGAHGPTQPLPLMQLVRA
jgi:two-component system chemotaxis sensor kinase CheA